jgi:hypothetical protein
MNIGTIYSSITWHYICRLTNECMVGPDQCQNFVPVLIPSPLCPQCPRTHFSFCPSVALRCPSTAATLASTPGPPPGHAASARAGPPTPTVVGHPVASSKFFFQVYFEFILNVNKFGWNLRFNWLNLIMLHSNSLNLRFILTKFDYVRMKSTKFDYVTLKITKFEIQFV